MIRDRLSMLVSSLLTVVVLAVYSELLDDFYEVYGFWFSLPLLLFVALGVFTAAKFFDELIRPKSTAAIENFDDHFPKPSVRAHDWDDRLFASKESVAAAMISAKEGLNKSFDIVRDDWSSFTAVWDKKGWAVRFFEPHALDAKLAVAPDSEWAGKEVPLVPGWKDIFKKEPEGRIDDATTAKLAGYFMGWESEPENIAWCLITEEE